MPKIINIIVSITFQNHQNYVNFVTMQTYSVKIIEQKFKRRRLIMYNNGTAAKNTLIFLASLLFAIMIAGIFTVTSNAEMFPWGEEPDVSLKVNGKTLEMDVPPKIIESRTMIPARALFEEIGGDVSWDAANYVVTINYSGQTIKLIIDSDTALVDGVSRTMDVPPQIVDDRTLIPLRFVSEALGFEVDWENSTRTAIVNTPNTNNTDPEIPVETPGTIEKISVNFGQESNMFTSVKIVLDKAIDSDDYKTTVLSNPDRYVIDFINFKANSGCIKTLGTVDSMRSAVSSVRSSMYDSSTFRLVFDLNNVQSPTISFSSDKKEMTVYFKKNTAYFNPYDDGKLVVMLDPGHGKSTPGKRSPDESLMEYEFNRDVAQMTKKILESKGITVLMTVTDDTDVSLSQRCSTANSSNADIFVSFHANAFGNGVDWENNAGGWEVYYYSTSKYGKLLADYIHDANIPDIGIKDRGVKTANFAVIKNTDMPAVLIEHGFYTNETEVELLKSSSWKQKAAELDAQGILNFLYSFK